MTESEDGPRPRRRPRLEDYGVIGQEDLQRAIERQVDHAVLQRGLVTREQVHEMLREIVLQRGLAANHFERFYAFLVQLFEENEASKGRVMRTVLYIAGVLSALATVSGALFTILEGHH